MPHIQIFYLDKPSNKKENIYWNCRSNKSKMDFNRPKIANMT